MVVDYKVSETLKELRKHSGKTQAAVSHEMNISRQAYSNFESGRRLPDLSMTCRLAEYYHISLNQLVLTGLHEKEKDPLEDLPEEYAEILRSFQTLSPEKQKFFHLFLKFLKEM